MIRLFIQSLLARWANWHPFIRLLVGIGVMITVGWIISGPAYHAFKQWSMDRNLKAAQLAVDQTQMQQAHDLSLTVLRSGNLDIQAFRILEKSAAALGDHRHSEIAQALISHPDGTDEDRLKGFLTVVETMPLGMVGLAWLELPANCRTQPRFANMFAKRLLDEKQVNESTQVLLGIPEQEWDSGAKQILTRTLISGGSRDGLDEAQRIISHEFINDNEKYRSDWLNLLESIPVTNLNESLLSPIRNLSKIISEEDSARVALIFARIDYVTTLPNGTAVTDHAIATWKDRNPELLARFLADLKLYRLLLETYPVSGLHNYPELLPLLLDATKKTNAWDDTDFLLTSNGISMPDHIKLAQRAILAMMRSNNTEANNQWKAAIAEAKSDNTNRALLKLHQLAIDNGLDEFATSSMLDAIRAGRGPLPLYKDQKELIRSLSETGQDAILLEVCAVYLNFEPSNPVLLTQYAYLACLNDVIEPSQLLPPLKLLAGAFPNELPIHTTLATTHLCAGQPDLADKVLEPFKLKIQKMTPSFEIVFLTSKVLTGKIPADDPQIENFPWKSLLDSEQKKFHFLINRGK